MTAITDYTDTDTVRAVMGVSVKDISDDDITNQNCNTQLLMDLQQWVDTHATIYSEGTVGTPTDNQIYKKDLLILYAQFFVAGILMQSSQGWLYKKISDGKIEGDRFNADTLDKTKEDIRAQMEKYKTWLNEALEVTTAAFELMGIASPDYDPVTHV